MCLFCIGGNSAEPTELNFGMEDHIYPREVIGYILLMYPYWQGPFLGVSGLGCCKACCSELGLCYGL